MPPSGDSRPQQVPPIPGRHRTVSSRRSPCARPVPRRTLVHPRTHPPTTGDTTPRPPPASPNVRTGSVASPLHPPAPGRPSQRRPPSTSRSAVRRSSPSPHRVGMLYQLYEADNPDRANQALGRFADLYATGQTPEYRDIVDTIIVWGEQILAYHTTRRVSDGPLEGINNLHPSPTTRRSRVHQPQQLPSPPNPRNTRTRRVCSAGAGLTHLVTGLWCLCHDLSTWPPPGLLNRGAG